MKFINIKLGITIILHRPIANLSKFNKGAYISGIKVFNHLPQYIKTLTDDHKYFKSTLKKFLISSFFLISEWILWI